MMYKKERKVLEECKESIAFLTDSQTLDIIYDIIYEIIEPQNGFIVRWSILYDSFYICIKYHEKDYLLFSDLLHEEHIKYHEGDKDTIYISIDELLDYLTRVDSKTLIQTMLVNDEVIQEEDIYKRIDNIEKKVDALLDKFGSMPKKECCSNEKKWWLR